MDSDQLFSVSLSVFGEKIPVFYLFLLKKNFNIEKELQSHCIEEEFQSQYRAEQHLALSNGHYGTGINKHFDENSINETFCPELVSPSGGYHNKPLTVDKLTRGCLSFSCHPFPFYKLKLQRAGHVL